MVDRVVVVDHWMDDGNLRLRVRDRETVIIDAARIEIASIPFTGDIELRNTTVCDGVERVREMVGRQARVVVLQERLFGHPQAVPTPRPFIGNGKLAFGLHAAAT